MTDYFRLIVEMFAALSALDVFSEKLVLVAFWFFSSTFTIFFYLSYGIVTIVDATAPTRLNDVVVLPEMVTSVSLADRSLFFTATVFSYFKLVGYYTTDDVAREEFLVVGTAFGMVFVSFSRLLGCFYCLDSCIVAFAGTVEWVSLNC